MAFVVADRVKETTTSTGTGSYTLGGAVDGFQTFSAAVSNGDTLYYAITDDEYWEAGLGTYASSGNVLARTTIFSSSNSNNAVNWGAGTKNIFLTYPASKAVVEDVSNNVTIGNNLVVGGTVDGVDIATRNSVLTSTTTTANAALPKAGGTMSGAIAMGTYKITGAGNPTAAQDLTTKTYVDGIAAAGVVYHSPVRLASTANLSAAYANGSSGVGATLTNNSTQAALVLDGLAAVQGNRVLIDQQSNAAHNGAYTVTTIGSNSANWVLTRATDADSYENVGADGLGQGSAFFVSEGNTEAGHLRVCSTTGTITFGTTNIVFALAADTTVYSAGTGLSLTGTTFSTVQDIATSATPVFAGGTFNGDVTFDGATAGRDVVFDRSANALEFADNAKATFGTGDDASIFFDATDFQINAGAGDLNLSASAAGSSVKILGSGESLAEFTDDGDVDLFHNGTLKFSTTAAGINVPGNITVTGTVDGIDVATRDGVLTTTTNTANAALPKAGGSMSGAITTASNAALELDPNGSGKVTFKGNATKGSGQLVLNCEQNSHGIVVKGPPHSANANYTLTLPNNDGDANQFLQTNGSGVTTWAASPVGTVTSVATGGGLTGGTITASGTLSHADTSSQASVNNSGAAVIQDVTLDTYGHVTGLTSHTMTIGNLGYTVSAAASNSTLVQRNGSGYIFANYLNTTANDVTSGVTKIMVETGNDNYIRHGDAGSVRSFLNVANGATNVTNNNQLTNGAGYITSYVNTTYTADGNYGMTLSGTAFRLEDDRRRNSSTTDIYSGNTHDYTFYDASVGIRWYTAGAEEMRLENDGDLHVDGNIVAYSTTVSDERLKTDIVKIDGALDKIAQLNGYTFTYTADGKKSAGVIAQEVQKVLPSAITESKLPLTMGDDDETEYMTVQYDQLMGLMVEAIKELKAEVAKLKGK
tara:strand:- start:100 stop:2895 length:2796 start_codon:yes stop_codon:yes gene_type:complete